MLPITTNLRSSFAPTSDQPWLTIDSVTDGVVKYSFKANPSTTPRAGNLTVLGATIPILQSGAVDYALGTTNLLVGPEAGIDSVTLAVRPSAESWTAKANVPWLHLDAENQSGTASKLIVFKIDTNPGLTRTGSLTVAGQEVMVTQAGASYVPSSSLTTVASGWPATNAIRGFAIPLGLAVDRSRDVYMFSLQGGIYKLSATDNTITHFSIRGLNDASPAAWRWMTQEILISRTST